MTIILLKATKTSLVEGQEIILANLILTLSTFKLLFGGLNIKGTLIVEPLMPKLVALLVVPTTTYLLRLSIDLSNVARVVA